MAGLCVACGTHDRSAAAQTITSAWPRIEEKIEDLVHFYEELAIQTRVVHKVVC